jgi:nitroreductase
LEFCDYISAARDGYEPVSGGQYSSLAVESWRGFFHKEREVIDRDDIMEAHLFRHACKVFDSQKKISPEDFEAILEAGRLSPSSFGFEPWRFLVVQDMQIRQRLLPVTWGAQRMLPTASHFVVILARKGAGMRYDSDYIMHMMRDVHKLSEESAKMRREKFEKFQREDFRLLDSERALFDWSCKQCYIALANMMSTASMLGIDSCAVEGFVGDEIESMAPELFGYDSREFGVAVMVAFGYRIEAPKPKTRQKMEDIVEWYL